MPDTIAELGALLRSSDSLLMEGWTPRQVRSACERGELRRVRRGWYIRASEWESMQPERRHLIHVLAVTRDARDDLPIASHLSAAAVHGLPLYRSAPSRVHITVPLPGKHSSSSDVIRHETKIADADIGEIDGIRCTSLERTVFDVARTVRAEPALAMADAALRLTAVTGRRQDDHRAEEWREALRARAGSVRGARGIRSLLRVIEFADGRAESAGESVSRLQLARVGFAVPRLQVHVPGPHGGSYWVDFGLDDVNAFGEFDGKGKYLDESQRSGRSLEQVMLDEKAREDWIRGTTNRRFPRWGSEHIAAPATLAERLAVFGIRPPS